MNLAILRGRLSSPPRHQQLTSGDHLVSLELTTRADDGSGRVGPGGVVRARPSGPPAWERGHELVVDRPGPAPVLPGRRRHRQPHRGPRRRPCVPASRRAAVAKAARGRRLGRGRDRRLTPDCPRPAGVGQDGGP